VGNATMSLPINPVESTNPLIDFYNISYAWYGLVGIGSCVVIGITVSLFTGGASRAYMASIPDDLMNLPRWCKCCVRSNQVFIPEKNDAEMYPSANGDPSLYQRKSSASNSHGEDDSHTEDNSSHVYENGNAGIASSQANNVETRTTF
jgi:hypothetical protein